MSHSKEPWILCQCSPDCFNIYSDQNVVIGDEGLYSEANPNTEADAIRIVACVNACVGIPTEQLERGGLEMPLLSTLADIRRESGLGDGPRLSELAGEIGKLKADRDSLKSCLASHDSHGPDGRNVTNSQFVEMRDEHNAAVRERDAAMEALNIIAMHTMMPGAKIARAALAKIGGGRNG